MRDAEIGVDVLSEVLMKLGLKNGNSSAARRGSTVLQSKRNVVTEGALYSCRMEILLWIPVNTSWQKKKNSQTRKDLKGRYAAA